jgi:hypothetical protein
LGHILADMLAQARAAPGAPVRRTLAHGLRVDFLVAARELKVQLSRPDVSPSLDEWSTVIRYLPGFPKSGGNPAPPKHWFMTDRHYMASAWALPDGEQPGLFAEVDAGVMAQEVEHDL